MKKHQSPAGHTLFSSAKTSSYVCHDKMYYSMKIKSMGRLKPCKNLSKREMYLWHIQKKKKEEK